MTSSNQKLLIHGGIAAILAWVFWPAIEDAVGRWSYDAQYSHAFLVPIFSGFLLWRNRHAIANASTLSQWWGLLLLAAGMAIRFIGYALYLSWLDLPSLLVCLAGWAATAGGWPLLRAMLPAILFLSFAFPLPYRIQIAMGGGLQSVATSVSTYLLQTFGIPAIAEGNIITLSNTKLGVEEACNGLSMLMTFLALATGFAMLVSRPWWDKVILIVSAIPIAIAANVIRIAITAALYEASHNELARFVFHDVAGWLMMPIALAMLFVELEFLTRVIIVKTRPQVPVRKLASIPSLTTAS